ncbi:DUF2529 family protein [Alteribacillus iranensis]|uniref:DUF2529 domain-containing protein n=1 Tax=Alteribacillus iranensis TaxID=930128 RepID=A0A1I2C0I0_9BACI|nr:DUF2529 family protein [Alteribacillus iranensis]SFE61956.1 protein of unknown function [Alteribacillus iranensis]
MKMFATQLQGMFQKIVALEEPLEDGARLLAQAPAGAGKLYVSATPELTGIAMSLAAHQEAPKDTMYWQPSSSPDSTDRVLLFAGKKEAAELSQQIEFLKKQEVPLVIVAPFSQEDIETDLDFTDIWIQTPGRDGIIPAEDGSRMGEPTALCSLFTGQLLYLYIKEMMEEFD